MKSANLRTKKGVIEVEAIFERESIKKITITGDFFIYPEEIIEDFENHLVGIPMKNETLKEKISHFYRISEITTPGIEVDDWVAVITKAYNSD